MAFTYTKEEFTDDMKEEFSNADGSGNGDPDYVTEIIDNYYTQEELDRLEAKGRKPGFELTETEALDLLQYATDTGYNNEAVAEGYQTLRDKIAIKNPEFLKQMDERIEDSAEKSLESMSGEKEPEEYKRNMSKKARFAIVKAKSKAEGKDDMLVVADLMQYAEDNKNTPDAIKDEYLLETLSSIAEKRSSQPSKMGNMATGAMMKLATDNKRDCEFLAKAVPAITAQMSSDVISPDVKHDGIETLNNIYLGTKREGAEYTGGTNEDAKNIIGKAFSEIAKENPVLGMEMHADFKAQKTQADKNGAAQLAVFAKQMGVDR